MGNEHARGRSRKRKPSLLSFALQKNIRRIFAAVLGTSLVMNGTVTPALTAYAAEAEDTVQEFYLESSNIYEAFQEALANGPTTASWNFQGDSAGDYNELLDADGSLYELKPNVEADSGKLTLRVFARLAQEELLMDLDEEDPEAYEENGSYELNGSEEIIFLLSNDSESMLSAKICVDNLESEIIDVAPGSAVETKSDMEDASISIETETEAAGTGSENADQEESETSGTEVTIIDENEKEPEIVIPGTAAGAENTDDDSEKSDVEVLDPEDNKTGSETENPVSDDETNFEDQTTEDGQKGSEAENENAGSQKGNSGDEAAEPEGDNEESGDKTEASDNKGETSGNESSEPEDASSDSDEDSSSDNASDQDAADTDSGSDSADSSDTGSDSADAGSDSADTGSDSSDTGADAAEGTVTASISLHQVYRVAATPSNADIVEEEETEDEKDSESAKALLEGTAYEPVLLDEAGAVAFVVSLDALGAEIPATYNLMRNVVEDVILPEKPEEWEKSKSKTATNLDENYRSEVTLALPSAEEELESDVVFVLDKSTSTDVKNEIKQMLDDLRQQVEDTKAKVNVGVVYFNKEAHKACALTDLTSGFQTIENAIDTDLSSGTNLHAGLLMGKKMLDEHTAVAANRKYLIVVSDGITYIYDDDDEEPTAIALQNGDKTRAFAGPDNWYTKYGSNQVPDDWDEWLSDAGSLIEADQSLYDIPYKTNEDPATFVKYEDRKDHAMSVDKALFESFLVFREAQQEGYHCYSVPAESGSGENYPWGPSFMQYLADGKTVSFSQIQKDVFYLLDAGSTVVDVIGHTDDYNFDFVNDSQSISLTVGDEEYSAEPKANEENVYTFGEATEGIYPYELHYYKDGSVGAEDEHFVWLINVPVSNFAPVQLTYTVQLMNPKQESGIYGEYDADGSRGKSSLYTNNRATLYPMNSNGEASDPEDFLKPTVSYEVKATSVEEPKEWEKSKSKTATNLDENYRSEITLALPSAEEELESDVVFVLDKSTSTDVKNEIKQMLDDLRQQVQNTEAKVNVGVVYFNKVAHEACALTDLTSGFQKIENAIDTDLSSGTNLHAGLLMGKKMLDKHTAVAANRKYLIVVSDGITYIYNEDPTAIALQHEEKAVFAGPDDWETKYGSKQAPRDWGEWLAETGRLIKADQTQYDISYETSGNSAIFVKYEERADHAMTIDKALFKSFQVFREAQQEGYNCYSVPAAGSAGADNPWGPSFMQYLADGKTVSFSQIQKDVFYLLDAGSKVVDVIGHTDDYNFDFVNDSQSISLMVGDEKYSAVPKDNEENVYTFGKATEGIYPYELHYYKDGSVGVEDEHFEWLINVPVSNFAPVQLTYTVQLMNPKQESGIYGEYDADGSQGKSSLYTNNRATLYPVKSDGEASDPEDFLKPTVSYQVENTPVPPTPDKKEYTIVIHYLRQGTNQVLATDYQSGKLEEGTQYDINSLIHKAINGYKWVEFVASQDNAALNGELTENLEFTVYYKKNSGGSSPGSGSSSGSGPSGSTTGGSTSSGGPGVTITPDEVPLANLPQESSNGDAALNYLEDGEVPLAALPKTGRTSTSGVILFVSSMMLALYTVVTRKKEEES